MKPKIYPTTSGNNLPSWMPRDAMHRRLSIQVAATGAKINRPLRLQLEARAGTPFISVRKAAT
jgi:hypothetical protein